MAHASGPDARLASALARALTGQPIELTGELPQIAMPILPPSSNETPRPDPFK